MDSELRAFQTSGSAPVLVTIAIVILSINLSRGMEVDMFISAEEFDRLTGK